MQLFGITCYVTLSTDAAVVITITIMIIIIVKVIITAAIITIVVIIIKSYSFGSAVFLWFLPLGFVKHFQWTYYTVVLLKG